MRRPTGAGARGEGPRSVAVVDRQSDVGMREQVSSPCGVQGLGQLAEQAGDAWGEGVADLGSAPTRTNDSIGAQRLQMSRDRGLADAEVLGEVAGADLALDRQPPDDADEVYFGDDAKAPGMRSAYMEDPDGHRVEIWTRNIATQTQAGPPHPVGAGDHDIE